VVLGNKGFSKKRQDANPPKQLEDESMRTLGAITPRGFDRLHRRNDGSPDDTGFKESYSTGGSNFTPEYNFTQIIHPGMTHFPPKLYTPE
jgi:hypothetical protein